MLSVIEHKVRQYRKVELLLIVGQVLGQVSNAFTPNVALNGNAVGWQGQFQKQHGSFRGSVKDLGRGSRSRQPCLRTNSTRSTAVPRQHQAQAPSCR